MDEKQSKPTVLFSLCWLGVPCRYHGKAVPSPSKVRRLSALYKCVPVCPECLGGLPVPRPAAPLRRKRGQTITDVNGLDVSAAFIRGAELTLALAQKHGIKTRAFLVKGSPSCDVRGFAGELLQANGIKVVNL